MQTRGKFIVVEGLDFSGKTTCIRNIENYLTGKNEKFYKSDEYQDLNFCATLRDLLNFREIEYSVETELFMYCASRLEHTRHHILPSLEKGFSVLADRYMMSTLSYQGARDLEQTHKVADIVKDIMVVPDLTIYLDIPVELMQERSNLRGKGKDSIESRDISFFESARENFIRMVEQNENAILIDASQSIGQVFKQSLLAVKQCMNGEDYEQ